MNKIPEIEDGDEFDDEPMPSHPSPTSKFSPREQDRLERMGASLNRAVAMGRKFPGLCFSCRWAFYYRAKESNHPIIRCQSSSVDLIMPDSIVECNKYSALTDLGLTNMVQIAHVIDVHDYYKDLKGGYR